MGTLLKATCTTWNLKVLIEDLLWLCAFSSIVRISEPLRSWLDLAFERCEVMFRPDPKPLVPEANKQANKWKIQMPGSLTWCLNLWVFTSEAATFYNFLYRTEKLPANKFLLWISVASYHLNIPLHNTNGLRAFIFFLLCMFSINLIGLFSFHWSWLIF